MGRLRNQHRGAMMPRFLKDAEEDVVTQVIRYISTTLGHPHASSRAATGTPVVPDLGTNRQSGQLVSVPREGPYIKEND